MRQSIYSILAISITFLASWLLVPSAARAEIYMYVDESGVRHFTNTPMASVGEEFKFKIFNKGHTRRRNPGRRVTGDFDSCIVEASRIHGISTPLLKAVIKVESDFDPYAVSKKGAVGLMQIMPFNFKLLSVEDPYDPWQNVMGGAKYLKFMLERFNGDLALSLAAYNAGPNAVDKYGCIPPYPETKDYVHKVLRYYSHYKNEG